MTEDRMKELLSEVTNEACVKKGDVYNHVRHAVMVQPACKRKGTISWIAATAAVALACFMGFTEPGRAFAANIISLFAPEKPVTVEIEGYTEEKIADLAPDAAERYVFYYDETQFERLAREGADVLRARDQDDKLPEVSLVIRRVENVSARVLYEDALVPGAVDLGATTSPIAGYGLEIWSGQEWNDAVTIVYFLDDGLGGVYEFTLNGFVEAYEGHIQRMKQILTTFTIVQ